MTTPRNGLTRRHGVSGDPVPAKPKDSAIVDIMRDLAAGFLKIGPTAAKSVGDILQLATGGKFGSAISETMDRGMGSIDEVVGSKRLNEQKAALKRILDDPKKGTSDLARAVIDNPRASIDAVISTGGSLLLPAGAAKGVAMLGKGAKGAKGATAAATGTGAVQNAASTYTSIKSSNQADKYKGAGISGVISLLAGGMANGGFDRIMARRVASAAQRSGGIPNAVQSLFVAPIRAGGQGAAEGAGSYIGESIGNGTDINTNQFFKHAGYGGAMGVVSDGVVNVVNRVATPTSRPAPTRPSRPMQQTDAAASPAASAGTAKSEDKPKMLPPQTEGAFDDLIPQSPAANMEARHAEAQAAKAQTTDAPALHAARSEEIRSGVQPGTGGQLVLVGDRQPVQTSPAQSAKLIDVNPQSLANAGGHDGIAYNREKGQFKDADGLPLTRTDISHRRKNRSKSRAMN